MCGKRCDHPLRADAKTLLGAVPKLSRGDGLYFAPKSEAESALLARKGSALHITAMGARAFDNWALAEIDRQDALSRELSELAEKESVDAELTLLCDGIKMMELHANEEMLVQYEKRLRNLCAEILRTGQGGGTLRACAACISLSKK